MPQRANPTGLVADASVLIDYEATDRGVLALIGRYVAALHVPSPVFEEVRRLGADDARELGIDVFEPSLADVLEAAAGAGPVSFQDRLCMVTARDAGWWVLSNDRALRAACGRSGVECLWGMEAMALLVEGRRLRAARAMGVAERIAAINPFITQRVLQRLRERIGQ